MSLLLKLGLKRPEFAHLVRKVTERWIRSKNETKLIYHIQLVVERSKPDLYGLLEGLQ